MVYVLLDNGTRAVSQNSFPEKRRTCTTIFKELYIVVAFTAQPSPYPSVLMTVVEYGFSVPPCAYFAWGITRISFVPMHSVLILDQSVSINERHEVFRFYPDIPVALDIRLRSVLVDARCSQYRPVSFLASQSIDTLA